MNAEQTNVRPAHPSLPPPARRRRRRWLSALAWLGACPLLALSLVWTISGESFTLDLLANLNAQWLALALAWTIACLLIRRRGPALSAALACVLLLTPMLLDRAAFTSRPVPSTRVQHAEPFGTPPLRVLHFNARSLGSMERHLQLMTDTDADVISLLGPSVKEQFAVIYGDGLEDHFPGKLVRRWKPSADGESTYITAAYLVARWPILEEPMPDLGEMREHIIAGVVQRPTSPFGVIAIHPRSPRNTQRWVEGNLTVDAAVVVARRMHERGLPVVVIADLNSTPSGYRSRHLCSAADLRRAKPFFTPTGTYPESWPLGLNIKTAPAIPAPWPTTLAIDDLWMSNSITVRGWSALPAFESEHRPILVDLEFPRPAPSQSK